ncbi:hypothetical protein [Flavitalea sp.]|nr:hypothetical protein [Flavitalea sp.]
MKQIIFSISLLLVISISALSANDKINFGDKAEQVFQKSFPAAECVKWTNEGDYRKVSFVLYGRGAQAFFSPEGDLLGTMRNIFYADLPIKVMMAIKKRFNNAVPFAITEINRVDGTHYKFSVETTKHRHDATVAQDGNFVKVTQR